MIVSTFRRRSLLLAACATAAIAAPGIAIAQTAEAEAPEEVVIVTATRRATGLQDVAVAVTALSANQLQDSGVRNIQDLTQLAPSLNVPQSENSASVAARIRGVGTQGSNPGLESSVGVFVDGVYRARNGVAFGDLGELSAVEVLRGPQGTLFGRNTSAGLLSVSTKEPSFDQGASVDLTLGNYSAGAIGLGVTGPISDQLAYRFYGGYRTRDGFITVNPGTAAERDGNVQNYYTIRGQLLWTPTDTFELRLIGDMSDRREDCCNAVVFLPGPTGALVNGIAASNGAGFPGTSTTPSLEDLRSYSNRTYDQTIEEQGFSAEANLDLGFGKLTSITAWRNWAWQYGQDVDFSGMDMVYRDLARGSGNEFTTLTQEFRLAGDAGPVNWLVGAFYSDETIDSVSDIRIGNDYNSYFNSLLGGIVTRQGQLGVPVANQGAFTAGGGFRDVYQQEATSVALFTHNIIEISDALTATLGLRYTSEDKSFRADYSTAAGPACRAFEQNFGLNPVAVVAGNTATAPLAAVVGNVCLPFWRTALDNLDHRQERSEKEWSGIVSLAYEITPDINTYASFSRGYKAGGFNLDRIFEDAAGSVVSGAPGNQTVRGADTSFLPEFVDAFELGLKTQFFDRALTMNFALYHQAFENFQLNRFNGIAFVVNAVPGVTSQGLEMDFRYRTAIDGLVIGGGYAYTDATYDDMGAITDNNSFLGRNRALYLLPGSQLTQAPIHAGSLTGAYKRPVGENLELGVYVEGRYTGEYNTGSNLDPRKMQDAFVLLNSRISLGTVDGGWELELWGRNLLDERYVQTTFDAFAQGSSSNVGAAPTFTPTVPNSQLGGFVGEPMTLGGTIRMRF